MSWLEDGIVSYILKVYESFFSSFVNIYEEAAKSPSSFNGTVWKAVNQVHESAVQPIAWSILGLFLMLELVEIMKRNDVKGIDQVYFVGIVFLKFGTCKLLMDNAMLIIDCVFALASQIIMNGKSIITSEVLSTIDTTAMADALDRSSILELLSYFLISLIIQLVGLVCSQLALIVVRLRFIEIYIFTAVASIPFATFPSNEYSAIGKNFIKRMSALALQSVFIVVVIYIYSLLVSETTFTATSTSPLSGLISALGYSVLLVIALFQTSGWSKSLLQAN